MSACEQIQRVLPDCHCFTKTVLPMATLLTNELYRINSSLLAGLCDIEITCNHYMSDKVFEDYSLINAKG